jgi:hypothetical protein
VNGAVHREIMAGYRHRNGPIDLDQAACAPAALGSPALPQSEAMDDPHEKTSAVHMDGERAMRRSAVAGPGPSALLSPAELEQLARACFVEARRTGNSLERRRMLAFADALIDLAETKTLMLHYERRLLN